jgi:hypothetical protein
MSRNSKRKLAEIDKDVYQEMLENRDIKNINLYESMELYYPTNAQMNNITMIQETWKSGDRFYKYASQYYSDPSLWYIIAFINKKPTDSHVNVGQIILIPTPIELIFKYIHNK